MTANHALLLKLLTWVVVLIIAEVAVTIAALAYIVLCGS